MITRDEELSIARVLDAASLFADEVIVVDTGSTDKTVEICLERGCKVYSAEWKFDFASARNLSLDKAKCDYVMWLDADDVITRENALKIRKAASTTDADVIMLPYRSGNLTFWRERIIRRSLGLRFVGRVHEVIEPRGKIVYLNIPIQHDKLKVGDPKRNLRIYEMMLNEGKRLEGRELFYYGSELYYNGLFDRAEKALAEFSRGVGAQSDKGQAALYLSRSVKSAEKKQAYLLDGLKTSFSPDLLCELGDVFLLSGELNKAKRCFLTALAADENITFPVTENQKLVPHLRLCYCYFHLGDMTKAKFHNDLALGIDPHDKRAVFNSSLFRGTPERSNE